MDSTISQELLKDPQAIEEIKRHLWIESEKAGHDIGFDYAAQDWLARFADGWLAYHRPQVSRTPSASLKTSASEMRKASTVKRRPAKSYARG